MAARRSGSGPDLVLFHGGMGSWRHWIRNVEPLSRHFTVHALDHRSYGDSARVPRETTGAAYLDLVREVIVEMFPGESPPALRRLLLRWRHRRAPGSKTRAARQPPVPHLA